MAMMVSTKFIEKNKVNISIVIFVVIFALIHFSKPAILYMPDGSFRNFGVGYKNKTVLPIWVLAIVLAILSYLSVRYYLLHYY
jgi:hypothetical protein